MARGQGGWRLRSLENKSILVFNSDERKHTPFNAHPENPRRIESIKSFLEGEGAFSRFELREAKKARREEVLLAHTEKYFSSLEKFCEKGGGFLDLDTYATSDSFEVALSACGALIEVVREAFERRISTFCLIRPPGHHALPRKAMGFCLFNNVAVAALYARSQGFERIAIIDWDAHHGNGTQEILYAYPILFISFHQSHHYPGTGSIREVGFGEGEGFTLNFPFPAGTGSFVYRKAFEEVVLPLLKEFSPQIILVSAGFDSHSYDPLSSLELHETDYFYFTKQLLSFSSSSLILSLEGGYDLRALPLSVWHCLRAFLGEEVKLKEDSSRIGEEVIIEAKSVAKDYWNI